MKKTYMQPQVELTLLAATTALLGISAVQELHQTNAQEGIQL